LIYFNNIYNKITNTGSYKIGILITCKMTININAIITVNNLRVIKYELIIIKSELITNNNKNKLIY